MKKGNVIFWLILMTTLLIPSELFADYLICVDPGHGGEHSGAVGPVYGVLEKDANLGVGLMTYSYLVAYYWWPIITRTEDINIDRPHRANIDKKMLAKFLKIIKFI